MKTLPHCQWLMVVTGLVALVACSRSAPEPAAPTQSQAPAPVANDPWSGKYEGDVMVRVSGTPGAHRVTLVAATQDCTGDIGLAGGEPAKDVSPTELALRLQPDAQSTCDIHIRRTQTGVMVSESGICTAWHGLTCTFNGSANRIK